MFFNGGTKMLKYPPAHLNHLFIYFVAYYCAAYSIPPIHAYPSTSITSITNARSKLPVNPPESGASKTIVVRRVLLMRQG